MSLSPGRKGKYVGARGDSGVTGTERPVPGAAPAGAHSSVHCVGEDGGRGRHRAVRVAGVMDVGTTLGTSCTASPGQVWEAAPVGTRVSLLDIWNVDGYLTLELWREARWGVSFWEAKGFSDIMNQQSFPGGIS